jgi:hypothetical protein
MGPSIVDALVVAYGRGGLLDKIGGRRRRQAHRRRMILAVLARCGGDAGREALERLAATERDERLQHLIGQALVERQRDVDGADGDRARDGGGSSA